MGAYQNPEQVKDYTMDVANAWANASNRVTEGFIKLGEQKINEYESRIKEYNQNKIDVKKVQQNLYGNIDKMAEGFGGADFRKTFDPLVQKYADISLRLKNNTSKDEASDMKALSRIEGMINLTKTGIEKQMSYKKTFNEAYANGANPGGFDAVQALDNKGNNVLNHLNSIYGNIPGNKSIDIEYDEEGLPTDVKFVTTGKLGDKEWKGSLSATTLNKSNDFGIDLIPTIPDASKILGEQLATSSLVEKVNVTNPTDGTVSSKIIGPSNNFYDFKMETAGKKSANAVYEQSVGKFNSVEYTKKLKEDPIFGATIKGLIATPQKAAALMNSTGYRDPKDKNEYTAEQFINPTPELQSLFADRTAAYYAANQPQERIETNNLGQQITKERAKTDREKFIDQIDVELERKPFDKSGKTIINTKNSIIEVIKDKSRPEGYRFNVKSNKKS